MKVAIILKNYLKVTGDDDGGDGSGEGGGGKKRSGRGLIKKRGRKIEKEEEGENTEMRHASGTSSLSRKKGCIRRKREREMKR